MTYIDYHISNRLDILREIKRVNRNIEKEIKLGNGWGGTNHNTIRFLRNYKKTLQRELEALIA